MEEQYVVGGIYDVFFYSSQQVVRLRVTSCSGGYIIGTYVGDQPGGRANDGTTIFFPHNAEIRGRINEVAPVNVVPNPILSRECVVGNSYEIEQTIFSQARTYTIRVTAVDDTEVHGTFVMPQHGLPEGQTIHLLHQFVTNVRSFSDSSHICGVPIHAGSEYAFQYRNYASPFYVRVREVEGSGDAVHGYVTVARSRPGYDIGSRITLTIGEIEGVTLVTTQRPPSSAAWVPPTAEPGREKKKWSETSIRITS